ncbi:MAG: hypothetical protein PHY59_04680 [Methanobacterium sp.]|nr:hypothetical protein [Methanobacterium sp.]
MNKITIITMFVIFLIISITPASAAQIADTEKQIYGLRDQVNELKSDLIEGKDDVEYVATNFWNPFKWEEVGNALSAFFSSLSHIPSKSASILDAAGQITKPSPIETPQELNDPKVLINEINKKTGKNLKYSDVYNLQKNDLLLIKSSEGYYHIVRYDGDGSITNVSKQNVKNSNSTNFTNTLGERVTQFHLNRTGPSASNSMVV